MYRRAMLWEDKRLTIERVDYGLSTCYLLIVLVSPIVSTMANSISLTSLSPREAVADALHRCITGTDDNDRALFESGMLKDKDTAFIIAGTDRGFQGYDAIAEYMFTKVLPIPTTHLVTGVRVDLKDDQTAYVTAHAVAYHWKPEDAFTAEGKPFTTGGMYYIDVVKDSDGLWKVKKWTLKINWTEGDRAIIE
jgi:SnoaL-like domain